MKAEKIRRTRFYSFDGGQIATIGSPYGKSAFIAYWAGKRLYTMAIDRREFAQNLREARKNERDGRQ